ncbi:MAG: class I SAM-dependent methyltransferase [Proteobacteria bacterium]|nr:class I SAM-dependent methyltransferase [Pseudomonadota bacterium]MBI3498153.1 class I SAM-dependent methyltransferase [Pseudomonadota bacterium]
MRDYLRRRLRHAKQLLFGYSPEVVSRERWEAMYARDAWSKLGEIGDLAHYSVILGYCVFFRSKTILDVCCGHGVLTGMLQAIRYEAYRGVDLSSEAVTKARARFENEKTRFFVSDAGTFDPGEKFDTIVFNECLYYFEKPQDLVRQYLRFLSPGGRIIVSFYDSGGEAAIQRLLERTARVIDRTAVVNDKGQRWMVSVAVDPAAVPEA